MAGGPSQIKKICIPKLLGRKWLTNLHQAMHLSPKKMSELISPYVWLPGHREMLQDISNRCMTCAQVNTKRNQLPQGNRSQGTVPGEFWELDFTEIKPGLYGCKYLLVFVDTVSGWVEAFPTGTETAQIVVKKLITEIVPRFGLPLILGSDNGPAFTAKLSRLISKALNINWKLRCMYHPQSSGKVERMNRTLKETLNKLILETGGNWVDLLPFALLRARCTPYQEKFTPYEIIYGQPPPMVPRIHLDLLGEIPVSEAPKGLQLIMDKIFPQVQAAQPIRHRLPDHSFQPGEAVLIGQLKKQQS